MEKIFRQSIDKMKVLGILLVFSILFFTQPTEGRFGLRRRSMFNDDDFFKPWTTFDMLTRDFDDIFHDDPFFEDDDFDSFLDHSPLKHRPVSETGKAKTKPVKDAGKGVCDKKCQGDKQKLSFPKLSSRVVLNNEKEFKFAMNVKGFDKKDISVKVENDFLKISGRKSCKKEKKCGERSFFRYQYLLPKHADLSKVKARFSKDGFLIVEMPKFQELDNKSNDLQIEDIDEEYLPKLKSESSGKPKRDEVKKDDVKKEEGAKKVLQEEPKIDEEATVEVLS